MKQTIVIFFCCVFIFVFQGKTVVQAEIDAAAELIDFFRFNAKHAIELEKQQPLDAEGSTNTMLYRGLEVRTSEIITHVINVPFRALFFHFKPIFILNAGFLCYKN